ncbi:MAG: septum site-determining protein MinD [Acinetobacter sp.]|nr:septum site-determining protein MinD [Acinetobacter sp.]
MAKIIVVTSGKGGVGKTTTSASVASGLAQRGFKTVVIDFDVGLRNLDLIMGCERRVVYDFVNVINGEARLQQALIKDKELDNLFILPASQTRDKDALTDEGVERIMNELSEQFDYIVCDSPAGIERGALLAMYHADEAIIVTNPEISSVRDSDRIIGMLDSKTKKVESGEGTVRKHLCITRFNPERAAKEEMLSIEDISNDILRVPTLGVIPECPYVLQASNEGKPVILYSDSKSGQAYDDLVARFLGEDRPYRHLEVKKKGFWASLFGG